MPHVRKNYLLLKTCLRKRGFATAEEAWTTRHHVYQCPACGKWHRTSRKEFKEVREKEAAAHKEKLKKSKDRRKDKERNRGSQMENIINNLRGYSYAAILTRSSSIPRHSRNVLKALKMLNMPYVHLVMEEPAEAVRSLKSIYKTTKGDGVGGMYIILYENEYEKDTELYEWSKTL